MPTRQIIVEVVPHRGKRLSQPLTRLQDHQVEIEERLKQLGIQITGQFVPSWSRNGYALLIAVGQVSPDVQDSLGAYLNDYFELEFGSDVEITVKLVVYLIQPAGSS
ncbi:MAG: hypothetical protein ACXV5Q_12160 [Frankiaceae bacterium]